MADRQTIGKLRLPLPPTRKVNRHEAPGVRLLRRCAPRNDMIAALGEPRF